MNFEVGTIFVITAPPSYWNSTLCEINPLLSVRYPYYGTIINIKEYKDQYEDEVEISMTDGRYGWSLTTLINENKIVNLKEERISKLNKLQNYGKNRMLN